jgi:alkylation response protein AidB-like acyl-CoA dehydrogenase
MFAGDEIKDEVLAGIASGEVRVCLGYTEPDAGSDLAAVRTRAVRDGDEWVIDGQKMFTTGAQFCQYCFCLTRTNTEVPKHQGLTVFLVPLDLPGVEIKGIDTLGGERTNFVYFDDVRVPDRYRLGGIDDGWATVSAPLAAEHGMGGGASDTNPYARYVLDLLDAVVPWLAATPARDGSPLLDDPRVRDVLVEMELDYHIAEASPGPMGRIVSAESLIRQSMALLDLVGPVGLVTRGSTGAWHDGLGEQMFRFAPGTSIYGGSTEIHRNLIAEKVLGLPRSTPRGS